MVILLRVVIVIAGRQGRQELAHALPRGAGHLLGHRAAQHPHQQLHRRLRNIWNDAIGPPEATRGLHHAAAEMHDQGLPAGACTQ